MPVGMYLSRCRNGSAIPDVDALAERFSREVEILRVVDDFFVPEVRDAIVADIRERGLGAVVLGGNSIDHFSQSLSAPELQRAIVTAGVNPNRIAVANLNEQVAMAHAGDPGGAQAKAEALLADALANARTFPAITSIEEMPERSVLVLGATAAGFVAVQRLLRLGHHVTIADQGSFEEMLHGGGLTATATFAVTHPECEFLAEASLTDADGWVGDFRVVLETPDGERELRPGGILIARHAHWIAPLRSHYALSVDEMGIPLSIGPAHPARTVDPGIMIVPPHADDVREVVEAGDSAALALVLRLSSPTAVRHLATSSVDESLCGGCASCVKTCAFGACSIDPVTKLSHVDPRRCHGCGKCVVSCPVGARDIVSSPHAALMASIRSLAAAPLPAPRVLGFLCAGCGYPAADEAGRLAARGADTYPASFLPVRIPCGGRLDALYVLEAFASGFDGVSVFRCRGGHCKNLVGNLDMDRRINLLRTVLRSRRIDDTRLRIIDISPDEGALFTEEVNAFFGELEPLVAAEGSAR